MDTLRPHLVKGLECSKMTRIDHVLLIIQTTILILTYHCIVDSHVESLFPSLKGAL